MRKCDPDSREARTDRYRRQLAYLMLSDQTCINEKMIRDGYAKPYLKHPCEALANYRQLNLEARRSGIGLYAEVARF